MGGFQGVGKDTIIEPVKYAVGPHNFAEVSPKQAMGRFNGFVKSVILRVSEAHDLGEANRYALYEAMKTYTAAPPDVLRCDEKHIGEYAVPNVSGVIFTTNHKIGGLYLPEDDRRHFVAWCDLTRHDFTKAYWNKLYGWYDLDGEQQGLRDVAAFLMQRNISGFNPKAPPRQTDAFWEIVDVSRSSESTDVADALDEMGWPDAFTIEMMAVKASPDLADFLRDQANRATIPHRMQEAGYAAIRNLSSADGRWKVGGKNRIIYAKVKLSNAERMKAAARVVAAFR
jgi:hypothetical protein